MTRCPHYTDHEHRFRDGQCQCGEERDWDQPNLLDQPDPDPDEEDDT